jgi:P-type conjugative transfer protein TrbJ
MRRVLALLIAVCFVAAAVAPASAQVVVTDPGLTKLAAQQWYQDLKNAAQLVNIATSGANQLKQAIQQTQYQLKNAKTLADFAVAGRSAQAEWVSLQNLVKVSKGIIVATKHSSQDIQTAFPGASSADKASDMMANYQQNMQGTIISAAKSVDVRLSQMESEEANLAKLRAQILNAQSGDLGTNQLLQLGLAIASESLDELRSMERLMAAQYQAQFAYMYSHSDEATQRILGQAQAEALFSPAATTP